MQPLLEHTASGGGASLDFAQGISGKAHAALLQCTGGRRPPRLLLQQSSPSSSDPPRSDLQLLATPTSSQPGRASRITALVAAALLLASALIVLEHANDRSQALRSNARAGAQVSDTAADDEANGDDGGVWPVNLLQIPGAGLQAPDPSACEDTGHFVWLADLHADPYYGTPKQQCKKSSPEMAAAHPYGIIGCDPPVRLLDEAINGVHVALADLGIKPDFLVHTGDLVRHGIEQLHADKHNVSDLMRTLASKISSSFNLSSSELLLLPLGNTDTPEDYLLDEHDNASQVNDWLARVARGFADVHSIPESCLKTYEKGGYCSLKIGGLRVLSINTLIYSEFHVPSQDPLVKDPFEQFAWLSKELEAATSAGEKVWIIGHIPPGIESYGYSQLWHPFYLDTFLGMVTNASVSSTIAAQLFGHVHVDEFRVIDGAAPGTGPFVITGALSPIYLNNPSFRIVEYCKSSGMMLNMSVFYADIADNGTKPGTEEEKLKWRRGYDLTIYPPVAAAASKGGITQQAFSSLLEEFSHAHNGTDLDSLKTYASWFRMKLPNELQTCLKKVEKSTTTEKCLQAYLCALVVSNQSRYGHCAGVDAQVWEEYTHELEESSKRLFEDESKEAEGVYIASQHRKAMQSSQGVAQDRYQHRKEVHEAWLSRERQRNPLRRLLS